MEGEGEVSFSTCGLKVRVRKAVWKEVADTNMKNQSQYYDEKAVLT